MIDLHLHNNPCITSESIAKKRIDTGLVSNVIASCRPGLSPEAETIVRAIYDSSHLIGDNSRRKAMPATNIETVADGLGH